MKPIVICFSGRIGSGKSTVSTAVSERLGFSWVSFGSYVRTEAAKRGLDPNIREVLADLGQSLIQEHSWEGFCKKVLDQAKWTHGQGLVVDGIRHLEAFNTISKIALPTKSVLVHLNLDGIEAMAGRANGLEDRIRAEEHSTEKQVIEELPQAANLVANADRPVKKIVDEILEFLKGLK